MARRANSLELFPGLVPVGLLLAGIPFAVWTAYALVSDAGADLVPFFVLAGWFVILGCAHLGLLGTKGIAWATIPVLLTIRAIVEFGAIPIWRAATATPRYSAGMKRSGWRRSIPLFPVFCGVQSPSSIKGRGFLSRLAGRRQPPRRRRRLATSTRFMGFGGSWSE